MNVRVVMGKDLHLCMMKMKVKWKVMRGGGEDQADSGDRETRVRQGQLLERIMNSRMARQVHMVELMVRGGHIETGGHVEEVKEVKIMTVDNMNQTSRTEEHLVGLLEGQGIATDVRVKGRVILLARTRVVHQLGTVTWLVGGHAGGTICQVFMLEAFLKHCACQTSKSRSETRMSDH